MGCVLVDDEWANLEEYNIGVLGQWRRMVGGVFGAIIGWCSKIDIIQIGSVSMYNISMSKIEKKLVKKTILPIQIIDDPQQLCGLVHFPTEYETRSVVPHIATATYKKNAIMYRNQLNRETQPDEEDNRRREVELYDVTINPLKVKEKQFKMEVPIVRGSKASKLNNKSNEVYFTFSFTNSEGKLHLLNGIQDAKMEILIKGKSEAISKERIDRQLMSMDNRRKEQPADIKYYEDSPDDD